MRRSPRSAARFEVFARLVVTACLVCLVGGWGAACGAFSLNDVVPDAGTEARSEDATSSDRTGIGDGSSPIPDADARSCVPDAADPCSCLFPTLVTPGKGTVSAITLQKGYVYWLAVTSGDFVAPWDLLADEVDADVGDAFETTFNWNSEDQMPVESGNFYFSIGATPANNRIREFPLEGGAVVHLVNAIPLKAEALRVSKDGVFWTNVDSEVCHAELDGAIVKGDSGCGSKPLVSAVTGDGGPTTNDLSLNSTSVYLSVGALGEILVAPIGGGVPVLVYKGKEGARLVFASDEDLVWSEPTPDSGGALMRSLPDGANPYTLTPTGPIGALLVAPDYVYFTTKTDGRIQRVPRDGGPPTVIACDSFIPAAIAIDDTFLYWGDAFANGIWKIRKH